MMNLDVAATSDGVARWRIQVQVVHNSVVRQTIVLHYGVVWDAVMEMQAEVAALVETRDRLRST